MRVKIYAVKQGTKTAICGTSDASSEQIALAYNKKKIAEHKLGTDKQNSGDNGKRARPADRPKNGLNPINSDTDNTDSDKKKEVGKPSKKWLSSTPAAKKAWAEGAKKKRLERNPSSKRLTKYETLWEKDPENKGENTVTDNKDNKTTNDNKDTVTINGKPDVAPDDAASDSHVDEQSKPIVSEILHNVLSGSKKIATHELDKCARGITTVEKGGKKFVSKAAKMLGDSLAVKLGAIGAMALLGPFALILFHHGAEAVQGLDEHLKQKEQQKREEDTAKRKEHFRKSVTKLIHPDWTVKQKEDFKDDYGSINKKAMAYKYGLSEEQLADYKTYSQQIEELENLPANGKGKYSIPMEDGKVVEGTEEELKSYIETVKRRKSGTNDDWDDEEGGYGRKKKKKVVQSTLKLPSNGKNYNPKEVKKADFEKNIGTYDEKQAKALFGFTDEQLEKYNFITDSELEKKIDEAEDDVDYGEDITITIKGVDITGSTHELINIIKAQRTKLFNIFQNGGQEAVEKELKNINKELKTKRKSEVDDEDTEDAETEESPKTRKGRGRGQKEESSEDEKDSEAVTGLDEELVQILPIDLQKKLREAHSEAPDKLEKQYEENITDANKLLDAENDEGIDPVEQLADLTKGEPQSSADDPVAQLAEITEDNKDETDIPETDGDSETETDNSEGEDSTPDDTDETTEDRDEVQNEEPSSEPVEDEEEVVQGHESNLATTMDKVVKYYLKRDPVKMRDFLAKKYPQLAAKAEEREQLAKQKSTDKTIANMTEPEFLPMMEDY